MLLNIKKLHAVTQVAQSSMQAARTRSHLVTTFRIGLAMLPVICLHPAYVMAILAPSLALLPLLISICTGLVMAMLSPLLPAAAPAGVLLPKMKLAIFRKPALDASRMVPLTARQTTWIASLDYNH